MTHERDACDNALVVLLLVSGFIELRVRAATNGLLVSLVGRCDT